MSTTPVVLTKEAYLKMTPAELKKIVHDPDLLAQANAILNGEVEAPVVPDLTVTPTPTPEEEAAAVAAKAEEDRVAAEQAAAEAAKTAAKVAEQEAYKAAGVSVETDAQGNITKIVKNYQAHDESGNPLGRPTHLEAKTWLELSVKQQSAHENAVRYAERVKKQTFTKKKDDVAPVQVLSEDELVRLQEELKSEDREKAAKAAEQVRLNDEKKKLVDADQAIENARAAKASYDFLSAHVQDFNRCEANVKVLREYILANNLEWTKDNLESAFIATESQLAPIEAPVRQEPAPTAPANPAPVAPAAVVQPPTPAATPAPTPTPNAVASVVRPGVNTGLVPGDRSAAPPSNQPKGLTKADIAKMPRDEYKRRLKDPKFVAEVNAVLARK